MFRLKTMMWLMGVPVLTALVCWGIWLLLT